MTNLRPTVELKAVESSAVRESIDRAKQAERDGRWADACAIYESLVRDPGTLASTRLAALRWLGRAYLEQGNRGAALDVLEAAVASADVVGSPPAVAQALNVIGIVYQVGAAVSTLKEGDPVLISCISSCGKCDYCRRGMYSHCTTGGWILGNRIDGTQAEYVRIPHAETSLYRIPPGADKDALVMLSDILPTGFECGVLNGKVEPGSTVAIVGAGPIGLASLLTAQFYSPAQIVMIDRDPYRLEVASRFGATACVDSGVDVRNRLAGYCMGHGRPDAGTRNASALREGGSSQ